MYKNKQSSSFNIGRIGRKKTTLLLTTALVTVGIITFMLQIFNIIDLPTFSKTDTPTTDGSNVVNYDPPTEEEKEETQQFKDDQTKNYTEPEALAPPPVGQKIKANPIISSWGQNPGTKAVEISGFVTGVYEDGGTCTTTITKDGQSATASRSATKDAKTISCGLMTIPSDRLTAGNWSISISYSSLSAEGTSEQNSQVEVKL